MTELSDYRKRMLEQASIEYDIEYHIVESIYRRYPDTFYDALEQYIKERSNGDKEKTIYI